MDESEASFREQPASKLPVTPRDGLGLQPFSVDPDTNFCDLLRFRSTGASRARCSQGTPLVSLPSDVSAIQTPDDRRALAGY